MKLTSRVAALLALTTLASAAYAQDIIATQNTPWKGFYIGGNIGGLWNHTCSSWEPGSTITGTPVLANAFYNRDCPSNGTFVGGAQIGYNFQWEQWVWGFGLDYEAYSAKDRTYVYSYSGPTPPPNGVYTFSGKGSPNGFLLLGPRVGYSVDTWLPYFRLGGVFTSGSHNFTSSFTDASGTATFSGGKNYNSSGFGAGFGVEDQVAQNWSVRAEYTYVNLGKGHNSTTSCTGSAATCTEFSNLSLDNIHNSFTANIFRVGINYLF